MRERKKKGERERTKVIESDRENGNLTMEQRPRTEKGYKTMKRFLVNAFYSAGVFAASKLEATPSV